MSKQLIPQDLAEIVSTLILKPELLGELDTKDKYYRFLGDIAGVVCNYCGGEFNQVSIPDFDKNDPEVQEHVHKIEPCTLEPYISISPSGWLPSKNQNVWAFYDKEGWDESDAWFLSQSIERGEPIDWGKAADTRAEMRGLLVNDPLKPRAETHISKTIADWNEDHLALEKSETEHVFNFTLSNQPNFRILNSNGDRTICGLIEIDSGEPVLRLYAGGDEPLFHVRITDGEMNVTPESSA